MTLMSHCLNVITGENIVINLSLHAYIYDNCPERLHVSFTTEIADALQSRKY